MKTSIQILHEQCTKHDGAMLSGSLRWMTAAMEEYAEQKVDEYKKSLIPTKNIWGADIKECDEFYKAITKNAGQRDI